MISLAAGEDDDRLKMMVRLVAALNSQYDILVDELHRAHDEIVDLRARAAGVTGSDPVVPYVERAESPDRKRTRYGEPDSVTRILPHED